MDKIFYDRYLERLFTRSFEQSPFDAICTFLRVKGLSDAGWDPFEESLDAVADFEWLKDISSEKRGERCERRIALLMYCQLVEMTAVHEMIANLLKCLAGTPYVINPFHHPIRKKKKEHLFGLKPPSAKQKFNEIKTTAAMVKENTLIDCIESFFHEDIRNAFSHSDFVLTDTDFRFFKDHVASHISLSEVDQKINSSFLFYSAFISVHRRMLVHLAQMKRFYKLPEYEVLELLSNPTDGIFGFHIHFANGSKATFKRKRSGTEAINMGFDTDGTIRLFLGNSNKLERVWKVDGIPVGDWETLEASNRDLE